MRLIPLLLLTITNVWAQTPLTHLDVVSSTINSQSHQITVTLFNHSNKMAVACELDIRQFDASDKPFGPPLMIGTDNVFSLVYLDQPNLAAYGFILPDSERKAAGGTAAMPDAVSVKAQVLAVAYQDRTAEGDEKHVQTIFRGRALHARNAARAVELFASYPISPEEAQEQLGKLAAMHERMGTTEQLLKQQGQALPDRQ